MSPRESYQISLDAARQVYARIPQMDGMERYIIGVYTDMQGICPDLLAYIQEQKPTWGSYAGFYDASAVILFDVVATQLLLDKREIKLTLDEIRQYVSENKQSGGIMALDLIKGAGEEFRSIVKRMTTNITVPFGFDPETASLAALAGAIDVIMPTLMKLNERE